MFKRLAAASFTIALIAFSAQSAYADEFDFPQCEDTSNLQVKVEYKNGTHGVPGRGTNYTGYDTVYTLENDNYLQCLCPDEGNGVQSDWLFVGNNEYDIESYVSEGWVFVADGSLWGLVDGAYLVKNVDYTCKTSNTPTPTPKNEVGGTITEEAASTSSEPVLGLADTGTDKYIFAFLVAGVVLFFTGKKLRA